MYHTYDSEYSLQDSWFSILQFMGNLDSHTHMLICHAWGYEVSKTSKIQESKKNLESIRLQEILKKKI